jgi:enamine deaminase RidA (YjgF/YER057c/UK114 family)
MSLQDTVTENLQRLGLTLPAPPLPGGHYEPVNVVKDMVYVAIQLPKAEDGSMYTGRLGNELDTAAGYKAAELCALNILAQVQQHVGFEKLLALNHFDAYYQAADGWDDSPLVINGASDLFLAVLGDAGKHTRAIFGVHSLPRNFAVGITATFTLR